MNYVQLIKKGLLGEVVFQLSLSGKSRNWVIMAKGGYARHTTV